MPGSPISESIYDGLSLEIDYANSTTNYYGYASPGSTTDEEVWAIKRETLDDNGRTLRIQWAGKQSARNQIWDNRTGLTYG